jgi:hypothetical protein
MLHSVQSLRSVKTMLHSVLLLRSVKTMLHSVIPQNTTQKSISIVFCVSTIRHSASTVNRSNHPPGRVLLRISGGGLLLFTVLAE